MGWWNAPNQTELIIGDIPLDRIGNLLEELQEIYLESLGRRPTIDELQYMIELSLKINGPGLFHELQISSANHGDFLVRKDKAVKYSAGDVVAFKIDEKLYGFARLIKKIELGYVSEIYSETAASPSEGLSVINKIKKIPGHIGYFFVIGNGGGGVVCSW